MRVPPVSVAPAVLRAVLKSRARLQDLVDRGVPAEIALLDLTWGVQRTAARQGSPRRATHARRGRGLTLRTRRRIEDSRQRPYARCGVLLAALGSSRSGTVVGDIATAWRRGCQKG
jgi:hypothetical protein